MTFDLEDWHSRHIPLWEELFKDLRGKDNVRSIEIGSCEGRSALWMMENVLTGKGSSLLCIDPFSTPSAASSGIDDDSDRMFRNFMHNISERMNVAVCRGYSSEELPKLHGLFFDSIYIDGSHVAKDVLTDIILSWPILKPGGILLMDDYEWHSNSDCRDHPKYAINTFLDMFRNEYELLHKGIQVAVRKK